MAEVRRGSSLCPHMASSKLKPETVVKAGMFNKSSQANELTVHSNIPW
jgi:hypothetical protein